MNSTFKLSLLAAAFTFVLPGAAIAATHGHHASHVTKHKASHHNRSKKVRGRHASYRQDKSSQDQATRDLNERSLQTAQSVNRDPNTGVLAPQGRAQAQSLTSGGQVGNPAIQSPVNNTVNQPTPPSGMGAPVGPANAPGAVNPNNMPPAN